MMAEKEETQKLADEARSIREIQQEFAVMYSYQTQIVWDLYSADQSDLLKDRLKVLIPDQEKGQKAIEYLRQTLFDNIWAQRKYTNGNLLASIIYVMVTEESDMNEAPESRVWSCHPVIRTRKCVDRENDSEDCCMIFVDETGRVYMNWKAYVAENLLPQGTMVAPRNGVYALDDNDRVKLQCYATPASEFSSKLLNVADKTSAGAGLLSACVPIAALCTVPVAAPVMAASAAVGLVVGGYSLIRSGLHLLDRGKHEQPIGLQDQQARNSWIGVTVGAVGIGAAGATKAMAAAAGAGREISLVTQCVVNGMNISSIVLSGAGLTNGVLDIVLKYRDNEDVGVLDYLQLSASLVLFTHSVANFRLAKTIINETQNKTIAAYREGLSNRQRRMFDKLSKETIRIRGESRGKIDIIRSANDIPSKQYLNDLYKINKNLNENNVRPAFEKGGGGIVLNNELSVDPAALRANVQHNQGPDILGQVKQPIPAPHNESLNANSRPASQLLFSKGRPQSTQTNNSGLNNAAAGVTGLFNGSILLPCGTEIALLEFGRRFFEQIRDAESFSNLIKVLADNYSRPAFQYLMNLAKRFVEEILDGIEHVLKVFITSESVLYRIMEYSRKNILYAFEELIEMEEAIIQSLKDYFVSLNPNAYPDLLQKCPDCRGFFYCKPL